MNDFSICLELRVEPSDKLAAWTLVIGPHTKTKFAVLKYV